MQKILLINPYDTAQDGFTNPPLGLLYLAGTLLAHGFSVRLVDGCQEGRDAVISALRSWQPDLVGITCLTPGRWKAIDIARHAKSLVPGCQVVLGGAHPTIMWKQMLQHFPEIDLIVIGEGEQTFLEIAQGKAPSTILGLAYRNQDGIPTQTSPRPLIEDLDGLPFPAWDLLDLRKYPGRGDGKFRGIDLVHEPRVSVIFSRGCIGRCDFCSTWWIWRRWRHRSPRNMVDELEFLSRTRGIRHFCFADDAMTVDREATMGLCEEILRRRLHIAFHVTTRTDCVDLEMLRLLKQAGCYKIAFGIETASPRLLRLMGKDNQVAQAGKAIRWCREVGLPVSALLIIGNVGETEETLNQTLRFLRTYQPDEVGCVGGLWILPGTKLFRECRAKNLIDDDFWLTEEPYKVYYEQFTPEQLQAKVREIVGYRSLIRRLMARLRRWSRR